MSRISPKVIDVEGNRVEGFWKDSRNPDDIICNSLIPWKTGTKVCKGGRFPTQLFTNNTDEKFKYVKNV